jgi:hypothetical protein
MLKSTHVMKKARIMLSAMLAIALVSGALAFKAKSLQVQFYSTDVNGNCVVPIKIDHETFATPLDGVKKPHFSSTTVAGDCTTYTKFTN